MRDRRPLQYFLLVFLILIRSVAGHPHPPPYYHLERFPNGFLSVGYLSRRFRASRVSTGVL